MGPRPGRPRAQSVNRVVDVGLELDPIVEGDDRLVSTLVSCRVVGVITNDVTTHRVVIWINLGHAPKSDAQATFVPTSLAAGRATMSRSAVQRDAAVRTGL